MLLFTPHLIKIVGITKPQLSPTEPFIYNAGRYSHNY